MNYKTKKFLALSLVALTVCANPTNIKAETNQKSFVVDFNNNFNGDDKYGCTPVDMDNLEDLNYKFHEMEEKETIYGVTRRVHKEIFKRHPEIIGKYTHDDLMGTIIWFNIIENVWNVQIGTRVYFLGYEELIALTGKLKQDNILQGVLKKTR